MSQLLAAVVAGTWPALRRERLQDVRTKLLWLKVMPRPWSSCVRAVASPLKAAAKWDGVADSGVGNYVVGVSLPCRLATQPAVDDAVADVIPWHGACTGVAGAGVVVCRCGHGAAVWVCVRLRLQSVLDVENQIQNRLREERYTDCVNLVIQCQKVLKSARAQPYEALHPLRERMEVQVREYAPVLGNVLQSSPVRHLKSSPNTCAVG